MEAEAGTEAASVSGLPLALGPLLLLLSGAVFIAFFVAIISSLT
jgi:hypothetical protein